MKRFWSEVPALFFLLAAWVVGVWIQFDNRAEVPLHFNAQGEVDRWGDASTALLLPAIALVLYGLLTWLQRHPKWCNYPVEITDANREPVYRQMSHIVGRIKTLVMCLFLYITMGVAQMVAVSLFLILIFALAILLIIVAGWMTMGKER
ncbi:DUF1648 domain-containing protein [Barnesiella sp. An55]|uniref:DUF1648 domain-containing protein n=1 Tax=Barnesiella sp. An55 TaxID=1965646 RepID=UPI000B397415|nr:DUF1648 domain-containing protein [Barnesiella sp. An55]OUN72473.1 hypothetical protein B5G10_07550 [Barnesiella sp. An55]HIZ25658.1 DUF1648 domain-containing protein [Candidatus Barnesiella merdipullorum]